MRLQWTADGFKVIDEAKNTVSVGTEGWTGGGDPPAVSEAMREVDVGPNEPELTVAGQTRALQFPPVAVDVESLSGDSHRFQSWEGTREFDTGAYLARVDAHVPTTVRFDGPAALVTVETDADSKVRLEFPETRPVSVGFDSRVARPDETVVVPETPDGVARALTALSGANATTSPDRTWPSQREQPARLEYGAGTHVPEAVVATRPDTGIELVVPPQFRYLTTAASLVHYLGARVTVEQDADPRLDLDGRAVPLPAFPEFQRRTAALLRRVFHLDCLARTAGPHGSELTIQNVVDELELDLDRLYDAPLAERAATYLDAPYRAVAGEFPDWHLTMHVEPTAEHVRSLPYLLQDLPQFFLPASTELSKKEWLRLTVADGYTETGRLTMDEPTRVRRELSNVDLVKPRLGPGKNHGWMAEKVPIDVFKTFPEAYENRERYLDDEGTELSVVAVLNDSGRSDLGLSDAADAEMRDEHEEIVTHYERRSEQFDIDLELRENVSTAELARIFESRNDLVHFIGHRDDRGLECVNGYFSTDTLSESNAQTFFLNACGSYPEGRALVKKGSVGGGVTFESVTNEDAVRVGTAFARLIVNGFCIERALDYTRRQLMTPKDYAVVGDGTHVVTQNDSFVPDGLFLFRDGEQFSMLQEQDGPRLPGGEVNSPLDDDAFLIGTERLYELTREEVIDYLTIHDGPVVIDEELYFADDALRRLRAEREGDR